MKRIIAVLLGLVLVLGCMVPAFAEDAPAAVKSGAYLVADAGSGAPLFGRRWTEPCDPSALTKLMTLGMACEKAGGCWDTPLTVSAQTSEDFAAAGASHISLQAGESAPLKDFLYAVMLSGANDACNVLGEYISPDGTLSGGIAAMNARAAALGLEHTHFVNCHGMTQQGQTSTPEELMQILHWALAQPGFSEIFACAEPYTMEAAGAQSEPRTFQLKDRLRLPGPGQNEAITGSKGGYTDAAGRSYACLAQKDGKAVLCVVMQAPDEVFLAQDMSAILDHAFTMYQLVTVPAQTVPAPVTVQGGGQPLGTARAVIPAFSVLLHTSLAEDAVKLKATDTLYTMGGPLPRAQFSIAGGGMQADGQLWQEMQLAGLEGIFSSVPGQPLARGKKSENKWKIPGPDSPIWVPGLILLVTLLLLTVIKVWQVRRKRLHQGTK